MSAAATWVQILNPCESRSIVVGTGVSEKMTLEQRHKMKSDECQSSEGSRENKHSQGTAGFKEMCVLERNHGEQPEAEDWLKGGRMWGPLDHKAQSLFGFDLLCAKFRPTRNP